MLDPPQSLCALFGRHDPHRRAQELRPVPAAEPVDQAVEQRSILVRHREPDRSRCHHATKPVVCNPYAIVCNHSIRRALTGRALITRQGGEQVLYGSALALTATTETWATATDTPVAELARTGVRQNLPTTAPIVSHVLRR
jgi:hypothetical protein